jgi:hypothetical protein
MNGARGAHVLPPSTVLRSLGKTFGRGRYKTPACGFVVSINIHNKFFCFSSSPYIPICSIVERKIIIEKRVIRNKTSHLHAEHMKGIARELDNSAGGILLCVFGCLLKKARGLRQLHTFPGFSCTARLINIPSSYMSLLIIGEVTEFVLNKTTLSIAWVPKDDA